MKKKTVVLVAVLLFLLSFVYYLRFINEVNHVALSYEGINGVSFQYVLDTPLHCVMQSEDPVYNGDQVSFECTDSNLSFLKKNIEFDIDSLVENRVDEEIILNSRIAIGADRIYAMNYDDGCSVYVFVRQEDGKYSAKLYRELYIRNNVLVQKDGDDLNKDLVNDEIRDIASDDLSEYDIILKDQGYIRIY